MLLSPRFCLVHHHQQYQSGRQLLLLLIAATFCLPVVTEASSLHSYMLQQQQQQQQQQQEQSFSLPRFLKSKSSQPLLQLDDDCTVVEPCQLCDAQLRNDVPQCKATGRVERWKCEGEQQQQQQSEQGQDEGGVDETEMTGSTTATMGSGIIFMYRSCKRTKADDEFLMVRMQVLCVLIGTAAFVAARKQKYVVASLFDQRRMGVAGTNANSNANSNSNSNGSGSGKRRSSVEMVSPFSFSSSTKTTTTTISPTREEMVPLTDDAVNVV